MAASISLNVMHRHASYLFSRLPHKWFLGLLLVAYIISFLLFTSLYARTPAVDALAACFDSTGTISIAAPCLKEKVRELMASGANPRALLAYTVASSSPNVVTANCHGISHVIGTETYRVSGDHVEAALSRCSSDCRDGCLHGVISAAVESELGTTYDDDDIAHADRQTIEEIGEKYCKESVALCHAIGHILYTRNPSILEPDNFASCARASTGFAREACYEGIFMEKSGEGRSLSLAAQETDIRTDDHTYPCSAVALQYRYGCYQFLFEYQRPLFKTLGLREPKARLAFVSETCGSLSGKERSYCFQGIGIQSELFGFPNPSAKHVQSLCDRFPSKSDRMSCTLGIIPRFAFIQPGDVLSYCALIQEAERQTLCFHNVFQYAEPFTNDFVNTCRENEACITHLEQYELVKSTLPDYRFGLFGEMREWYY